MITRKVITSMNKLNSILKWWILTRLLMMSVVVVRKNALIAMKVMTIHKAQVETKITLVLLISQTVMIMIKNQRNRMKVWKICLSMVKILLMYHWDKNKRTLVLIQIKLYPLQMRLKIFWHVRNKRKLKIQHHTSQEMKMVCRLRLRINGEV